MKKLLVSLLAIAGLVACTNDEVVNVQKGNPITFDSFVENATRANDPSTTTNSLNAFRAWAYMDNTTGVVLNDELVEKVGSVWSYVNTQYWMPGHTYYFAALAPVNGNWALNTEAANNYGAGIVDFINVDGSEDLLYAATAVESKESGNLPVKFQFSHLLSKINFTFVNGFATSNVDVEVKNVTMTAPASASINLAVENWWDNNDWVNLADGLTLEFGDVVRLDAGQSATATDERLTIPASAEREYEVEFDIVVYSGAVPSNFHKTATIKGVAFEMGKAYNLTATISPESLDLEAIEFEVAVNEWEQPNDFDLGAIDGVVKVVSTIGDLQAALNEGASVVLGADLAGNVTVPEFDGKTISINGNGKTFDGCFFINGKTEHKNATTVFNGINFVTSDNTTLVGDAFIYCGEGMGTDFRYPDNVTIKNCTFTASGAAEKKAVAAKFWSLDGKLVVEGCEANGLHSLMQVTSSENANIVVDGVKVANGKNGISLDNAGAVVIRNSEIATDEYGVRANSDRNAAEATIKKSTIAAKKPVIVRKVTKAGYVLNVDEASVFTTSEAYQVVFTKGADDAAYVAPEVDFTFNGPADFVVFPTNYVVVDTTEDLETALANEAAAVVDVIATVDNGTNGFSIARDVVLDMNGNDVVAGGKSTKNASFSVSGDYDLTINDADITGGSIMAYYGAEVVLNNTNLTYNYTQSGRNMIYVASDNDKQAIAVIDGGDYTMTGGSGNRYVCAHGNAIVYIKGGNFSGKSDYSSYAPFEAVNIGSYTAQIIISGGTFNFDPSKETHGPGAVIYPSTSTIAAGYKVVNNGNGTWSVVAE